MTYLRVLLCLILCTAFVECAKAEPWTPTEYVMLGISSATLGADWRQTREIHDSCTSGGTLYEKNRLLGRCPSTARVNMYFAGALAANYFLADYLGDKWGHNWRKGSMIGVSLVEATQVTKNEKLGLFIFVAAAF